MGTTTIEWTDVTWNPVIGCSIVSAGCRNCYAMRIAHRLGERGVPAYVGATTMSKRGPVWTGKLARASARTVRLPLELKAPCRIFVNSMSDFFHEDMPDEWRDDLLVIMRETPRHRYQILTKRPEVAARWVDSLREPLPPHVWLGVSVEDADTVRRIDILRRIPCHIRFVSFEPLIGPVHDVDLTGIHWAIIGGESGSAARLCDPEWVRELIAACRVHEVAVFFKQWGTYPSNPLARTMVSWPRLTQRELNVLRNLDPHGKGGALVDGRLVREMPHDAF